MLLTIDVGNSHITMGAFQQEKLKFITRVATERGWTKDQYAIELSEVFRFYNISRDEWTGAIISCVVSELSHVIPQAAEMATGCAPLIVGPGLKTGLNIRTDFPSELGADLVVGAVAAIENYALPCLVIDLGTATKISVLDKNGSFLGCSISSGIGISLKALATQTSSLPHISIGQVSTAIGKNTLESMSAGAVLGTAAMIDGLVDRMQEELGEPVASIVATGGYSPHVIPSCKHDIVLEENLLLHGLNLIYQRNVKNKMS